MIRQIELTLPAYPRGYHLITQTITKALPPLPSQGILHIFLKHTSAAITINENADPSVRVDFETILNRIVPEGLREYTHTFEGDDDMPAHVKAALIGNEITIPITQHRMNLGTWQGIYLCEFRNRGGARQLVMTLLGE